jgi:hypothetical protein
MLLEALLRELPAAVPINVLLALEPEELGAKLLFLVRGRQEHMFHPAGMATELWGHDVPADERRKVWSFPLPTRMAATDIAS